MIIEYTLTEKEFKQIKEFVYQKVGINLTDQKKQLVITRLSKRLRALNYQTFTEYIHHLINNDLRGVELEQLINQISTNKTHFFRESIHFDFLNQVIFPRYPERLSLWCAASSTGEEPYSLAISLKEFYEQNKRMLFRFVASDIDTNVLKKAQEGIYEVSKIDSLDKRILHKHFLSGQGTSSDLVKVKPYLRNIVSFRQLNLISFPYFFPSDSIDVVFIRNVLIYFDSLTKKNIINELCRVVRSGGFVVFGISDSVQGHTKNMKFIKNSIYQVV